MEKKLCSKLALVFLVFVMLFAQFSFVKADESVMLNSTLDSSNTSLISGNGLGGVQIDNEYFSVNTGRFSNASQTQDNFYDDGEGNTFGIYVQPTSTIDPKASTYYYEDIFNDDMLDAAAKSFVDTIVSQQKEGQSFNGIDELKIDKITNSSGESYPVLFWKFSIKYGNTNYFFYVYEIIDKTMMYNMTFSATSYDFLEGNNVKSVLNSFKIKNYQEFDHKSKASNLVSSAIHSNTIAKIVGTVVAAVVFVILTLIGKMKKNKKEEKEIIAENTAKPNVEVKPVDDDGFITPGAPAETPKTEEPASEEKTETGSEVEKAEETTVEETPVDDNPVEDKTEDNNE